MEIEVEGIVLCRKLVPHESGIGAESLIELFNALEVSGFPVEMESYWFYATLVGVRAPTKLSFTFSLLDPNEPTPITILSDEKTLLPPKDARDSIPILFNIRGTPLPRAGEYRLEIRMGSRVLGRKRLFVTEDSQ